MIRNRTSFLVIFLFAFAGATNAEGQQLQPSDPIASIDRQPIYLGELNLILTGRLGAGDAEAVDAQVRKATAALLVRRHLAMKTLREKGGEALATMLERNIGRYADEAKRRGTSLAEMAQRRGADETSFKADLAWQFAWSQYLKSRLTDQNLRRYFDQNRERYAGQRWLVSQIFLDLQNADASTVRGAERVLTELKQEIEAEPKTEPAFAQAARQHSDAGGSAEAGGKVGWVEKDGDLPTSVMNVIRETETGELGGPVRSPLGLHLVYVHRIESGELSFDELTDQSQLRRDASNALFEALVQQQRETKVTWLVPALQPPDKISIVP